jgi:hypothetical protein
MMKHIGLAIFSCLSLSACVPDSYFYRGYSSPNIDTSITVPADTIMQVLLHPTADEINMSGFSCFRMKYNINYGIC